MATGNKLMSFHDSASFAWKAESSRNPADYTLDLAAADFAQAYEEVRAGRGFVVLRGLPAGGSLGELVAAVREVGRHFGHLLSQNAQGELVGHVIDATKEDPTVINNYTILHARTRFTNHPLYADDPVASGGVPNIDAGAKAD